MKLRFIVSLLIALTTFVYFAWDSRPFDAGEAQVVSAGGTSSAPRAVAHPTTSESRAPAAHAAAPVPTYNPYNAYIYVPVNAAARQPLQVVIALHGMGGAGKDFAAPLLREADRNGWLLVAPTFSYGDWRNPDQVAQEDLDISQRLVATIAALPERTKLHLKARVQLIGFSRGAQVAHRFALFFPEDVDRVVAFSAGTYTLPYRDKDIDGDGLPDMIVLPYGTADLNKRLGHPINPIRLRQVRFFIGVGGADNSAADVPRQWDPYEGRTRLERAREFAAALQSEGVRCTLQVFPGVGHEITIAMLNQAVQFLTSGDSQLN